MEIDLNKILELSNKELQSIMNSESESKHYRYEFDWHHGSLGFHIKPSEIPETGISFQKIFYQDGTQLKQVEYARRLVNKTCFVLHRGVIENYPEILDFFKQGYLSKTYNQIDIVIEDKKFVSYTTVWNQEAIDNYESVYRYQTQPYRSKYDAKFKPWYLDQGNFTELPAQEIHITNTIEIDSFASLTNYLKSIPASTKDRLDCTFLTFQISDYSSITTVKKEEYVYLADQDPERDKPHAYIQEIKFSSEDLKKIFEGFKVANLWDAYTIEFQLKADGTFDYYVLNGYKKWINGRDVDPKSYEAFEKEMAEGLNEELNQSDEPITSDYLLQNIYGCISANVPDDFASIEAIITRSFDGDVQQLSGSYSYKPKGLFSSSKPVEPGEQIYPINVTIRLLDEFYTEESKDWRKAVLTFKNDGTCNVKIGK